MKKKYTVKASHNITASTNSYNVKELPDALDVFDFIIPKITIDSDLLNFISTKITLDNGYEIYVTTTLPDIILIDPSEGTAVIYYGAMRYFDEFMEIYTDIEINDPDFEFMTLRGHSDVDKDVINMKDLFEVLVEEYEW